MAFAVADSRLDQAVSDSFLVAEPNLRWVSNIFLYNVEHVAKNECLLQFCHITSARWPALVNKPDDLLPVRKGMIFFLFRSFCSSPRPSNWVEQRNSRETLQGNANTKPLVDHVHFEESAVF